MKQKTWVLALAVGLLGAGGATQAAPIVEFEPLPGLNLNPGDTYRYAFVTSQTQTRDATSSDITDYNTFVQQVADAAGSLFAGAGITWKAIASTPTTTARDNIGGSFPESIYRVDGTKIDDGSAGLWDGGLQAPISIDELGVGFLDEVWTGSLASGLSSTLPLGIGSGLTTIGNSGRTSGQWAFVNNLSQASLRPLYAISVPLQVPQGDRPGAAPVPPTITLLGLGLLAAVASRRRLRR